MTLADTSIQNLMMMFMSYIVYDTASKKTPLSEISAKIARYDIDNKLDANAVHSTFETLISSTSALEFKVNNELFGIDPNKAFQDAVDFCAIAVVDNLSHDFYRFVDNTLRSDRLLPMSECRFRSSASFDFYFRDVSKKVNYEKFFDDISTMRQLGVFDSQLQEGSPNEISRAELEDLLNHPAFALE